MNYRVDRVSDEEMYFFDLRGYLVIPGVLDQAELNACNAAIDAKMDEAQTFEPGRLSRGSKALSGKSSRVELTGMLGWEPEFREPFRKLLVNPYVVSRLNEFCGKGFRLDHGPLLISAKQGAEGHRLHGGGTPFDQANWYHQQNGKIYCRGITVAWQLTDCDAGDGGFCIVPGSHKTAEPTPAEVRSVEDDMGLVQQVAMKAGDLLFFAETATHGMLPWKANHDRRSVLYKYASRAAARAVGKHFTPKERYGDWTDELTPEQQAVLYGPGVHHGGRLPVLNSDGDRVWIEGTDNDPNLGGAARAKKAVQGALKQVSKKAVKKAAKKAAKKAKKAAARQTRAAKKAVKKAGKQAAKQVKKATKTVKKAKKAAAKRVKKTLTNVEKAAKKAKKTAVKQAAKKTKKTAVKKAAKKAKKTNVKKAAKKTAKKTKKAAVKKAGKKAKKTAVKKAAKRAKKTAAKSSKKR